jgi:hypothetical protein
MDTKELIRFGVPVGERIALAHEFIQNFIAQGNDGAQLEAEIFSILANPPAFFADEQRASLARAIYRPAFTPRAELTPWRQWGEGLEAEAVKQMANACTLPGALMPDAHVGYGLPIGRACNGELGYPLRGPRGHRLPREDDGVRSQGEHHRGLARYFSKHPKHQNNGERR